MSDAIFAVDKVDARTVASHAGPKPYLIPFEFAIRELGLEGDLPDQFKVTREQLIALISTLLRGVEIDEQWYLAEYPDIKQAIERGKIASARDHFIKHGYREGRHAVRVKVDESFYLRTHPDVAEGIEVGEIRSAQEHFDDHGRDEGRLPYRT
jgi:hypothetical protein